MKQTSSVKIDQLRINIPYGHIAKFKRQKSDLPKQVLVIDQLFHLTELFHENSEGYGHNGYTTSYNFGSGTEGGSISVMWNESREDMGILVDFTATGKSLYEDLARIHGLKVNWREIIYTLHRIYQGHLSRIDVAVDLINYGFSVNEIYQRLKNEKSFFLNSLGNKISSERFKIVGSTIDVQTLYVGSRKSDGFLRIYNKKLEQTRPNGIYRNIAYKCNDWIRIEAEFKHRASKELGNAITKLNDEELYPYLVAYLMDRWSLVDVKES